MHYSVPLTVTVVPRIIQQSRVCSLSALRGGFSSASRFGLAVNVARGLAEFSSSLSLTADQTAVAIVQMTGSGISWTFQTEKFAVQPNLEVPLNPEASNLNGTPFAGSALLGFSLQRFSLFANANLLGVPSLPPSNGEKRLTVTYTLVVDGVPIEVEEFEATMNVSVITSLLGGPHLSYTMGEKSIPLGFLTLPNFSFPFGTTRATGNISLSGGGFSIDWPIQFTVDPFQQVLGAVVYPGNLQKTTGFGANFFGNVLFCNDGGCPEVLDCAFSGATTASNTPSLLVPNYVPLVTGTAAFILS